MVPAACGAGPGGLSAAYAAKGERTRAGELLGRAMQAARDSELPEHNAAAASLAKLYWSVAVGCARLDDVPGALEMTRSAVRSGWRDAAWMERDPELRMLREEGEFQQLFEQVRCAPRLRFEATQGS